MPALSKFEIDDKLTFAENLEAFEKLIEATDVDLAAVLIDELKAAIAGKPLNRDAVLDRLFEAMKDVQP